MQVTLFSLLMSVVWSSVLAAFNYLCRKKHFFIRQLGITNLLFLYLFSIVRMLVPYEFSFTRQIPSSEIFSGLYKDADLNEIGTSQISVLPALAVVWALVSVALMIRFVWQYARAMAEFSTYSVRDDEQCQRVFNRVLNASAKQMKITIRRSARISIPMGAGIFRKSILLPDAEYSDSQLYFILRHEYTHFQNRDLLMKAFIHIYWCIFGWNPAIYLLKRDFAQVLEIKCDLDVTEHMGNAKKAEYLTTIVTMLKHAEAKRQAKAFYGTTALVSKNYESEILERFKIVSGSRGHKRRNLIFTGSWFLVFGMLIFASYSFVIRPDYEISAGGSEKGSQVPEPAGNSYRIKCVDGTYYVYFQ